MAYEEFKRQPRLPKFAVPKRYDINLKPDLVSCCFNGNVSIEVLIVSSTKFLVLNTVDLNIDFHSISFKRRLSSEPSDVVPLCSKVQAVLCLNLCSSGISQPEELRPVGMAMIKDDEIMVLEFVEELPIGEGVLSISFEGTLNDQMRGFYRSGYKIDGIEKNMAITHFQPASARRCFPCWDEPAAKGTFKITVEVPLELIALSNMPIANEIRTENLKTVHFEESFLMSTYLVAIVVGQFDYVESHTSDGVPVRCYSPVGKSNQGKFGLDVAVQTLQLYKEYFETPYPLPKLDMVAVSDFPVVAMENSGLVIYWEISLLFEEHDPAAVNLQMVPHTIAHELAHQWFGNLVTVEWWTHLWLSEGFATWVSYFTIDTLFPEWKIWTQFAQETAEGLRLDALAESHPIEVEVNHANEIEEIFDAICYSKGASVIRMLQNCLGEECFQRGLALYVKEYAFSNANTEDLWTVLEEVSRQPVNSIMHSWTKQKGYPVISVKLSGQKLEIEQSHFLLSGNPTDSLWIVPVTLCSSSSDTQRTFLLMTKSAVVDVEESEWIKVNVHQTGFYRVKYDDSLLLKLRHAVENNLLSATDRFGLLDDSCALCMGCQLPLASMLIFISSFREELDHTVLSKLLQISYICVRIVADAAPDILETVKQFFINLIRLPAAKLGWEPEPDESHLDALLRGEVLSALALLGHNPTIDEGIRRFNAFLDDKDSPLLPSDCRKAAYVAVMRKVSLSDKTGLEALFRVYRDVTRSTERARIIGSLACCPDPDIVREALNFLLNSEVKSLDVTVLSVSIEGRKTAWEWLKENWNHISAVWGPSYRLGSFITEIVQLFSSHEMEKEVEEFFASRTMPSIARTVKQSIEWIQINARWVRYIQTEERLAEVVLELASINPQDPSCAA